MIDSIINAYVDAYSGGGASFMIGVTIALVIAIALDHTYMTNKEQLFWGSILWLLSPIIYLLMWTLYKIL